MLRRTGPTRRESVEAAFGPDSFQAREPASTKTCSAAAWQVVCTPRTLWHALFLQDVYVDAVQVHNVCSHKFSFSLSLISEPGPPLARNVVVAQDDTCKWVTDSGDHDNIGKLNKELLDVLVDIVHNLEVCPQTGLCVMAAPWNHVGLGADDLLHKRVGLSPRLSGLNVEANGPSVVLLSYTTVVCIVSLRKANDNWLAFCGLGTDPDFRKLGLARVVVGVARLACKQLECHAISGSALATAWQAWQHLGARSVTRKETDDHSYQESRRILQLGLMESQGTAFFMTPGDFSLNDLKLHWSACKQKCLNRSVPLVSPNPHPNPDRDPDQGMQQTGGHIPSGLQVALAARHQMSMRDQGGSPTISPCDVTVSHGLPNPYVSVSHEGLYTMCRSDSMSPCMIPLVTGWFKDLFPNEKDPAGYMGTPDLYLLCQWIDPLQDSQGSQESQGDRQSKEVLLNGVVVYQAMSQEEQTSLNAPPGAYHIRQFGVVIQGQGWGSKLLRKFEDQVLKKDNRPGYAQVDSTTIAETFWKRQTSHGWCEMSCPSHVAPFVVHFEQRAPASQNQELFAAPAQES